MLHHQKIGVYMIHPGASCSSKLQMFVNKVASREWVKECGFLEDAAALPGENLIHGYTGIKQGIAQSFLEFTINIG